MTLTAKDVAQITRLLEESIFDEMILELDGLKLTLRRQGAESSPAPVASPQPPAPPVPPAQLPQPSQPANPSPKSAGEVAPAAHGTTRGVTAPLLGTFYRAPKPGAQPFIEVGSRVEEDTIIGIIEVMKLMNTVRAGTRGTVIEILAQDGALVEYGEVLVRVSKEIPA